jgi:hypothetical protein
MHALTDRFYRPIQLATSLHNGPASKSRQLVLDTVRDGLSFTHFDGSSRSDAAVAWELEGDSWH